MLKIEKIMVRNISAYQIYDTEFAADCPVVIGLHGLGSNKDSLLPHAERFAQQGIAVLLPDAPLHGERGNGKNHFSLTSLYRMLPLLPRALNEMSVLLQYIKSVSRFNQSRIGITGVSMGGALTLGAMAKHPEIKAGVALLAMDSAKRFAHHHNFSKMMWPIVAYLDSLIDQKRIPPRPLLLLNGANDPLIPVRAVRDFVGEMQSIYGEKGQIELVEYPGVGHEVVPDMVDRTGKWLASHL